MQNMYNYAYFCYRYKTVTARRDGSPSSINNGNNICQEIHTLERALYIVHVVHDNHDHV